MCPDFRVHPLRLVSNPQLVTRLPPTLHGHADEADNNTPKTPISKVRIFLLSLLALSVLPWTALSL